MLDVEFLLLVIGMGLATYIPRWFPLLFLSQWHLPEWLVRWLDLIPAALLSALLFPDLFVTGPPRHLDLWQARSLVAVPTFLFALKTKSLGGTVLVGMLLFWIADKLL